MPFRTHAGGSVVRQSSDKPNDVMTAHIGEPYSYDANILVLVSNRNGKSLDFRVPSNDEHIQRYLGVLHHLLTRPFQAVRQITVETIGEGHAAGSDYEDALRTGFEVRADFTSLILFRKSH